MLVFIREILENSTRNMVMLNLPEYNHECNEKFFIRQITAISTRKFYYINWNKRSKQIDFFLSV